MIAMDELAAAAVMGERTSAIRCAGSKALFKVLLGLRERRSLGALHSHAHGHAGGARHLGVVAHRRIRVSHVLEKGWRGGIGGHSFHLVRSITR
jgi:hypothetical protein